MKFTKMQGIGNDYIYINCFEEKIENPQKLAIKLSNRNFGIGADGLVLILPDEKEDFLMRMFNADGSEGEMCGNAARCIGRYVYDYGLTKKTEFTLNTLGGVKNIRLNLINNEVDTVTVDMGEPIFEAIKIPVASDKTQVIDYPLTIFDRELLFTCLSMGNPHAVTFVESTEDYAVSKYGSKTEGNSFFPKKANIEFVQVIDRGHLKMRVWERGSGETLACGTGACAALAAAHIKGYANRQASVELLGGTLLINWDEADGHIYMTGPTRYSFSGEWPHPFNKD